MRVWVSREESSIVTCLVFLCAERALSSGLDMGERATVHPHVNLAGLRRSSERYPLLHISTRGERHRLLNLLGCENRATASCFSSPERRRATSSRDCFWTTLGILSHTLACLSGYTRRELYHRVLFSMWGERCCPLFLFGHGWGKRGDLLFLLANDEVSYIAHPRVVVSVRGDNYVIACLLYPCVRLWVRGHILFLSFAFEGGERAIASRPRLEKDKQAGETETGW